MPGRLQNKTAIVTGASSGIGRAVALAYSAEGAQLVCADIRESSRAEDEAETTTHDLIKRRGGRAIYVHADVTKPESVASLVQAAVTEYGRLDVMVNNAGIGTEEGVSAAVWDVPVESWNRTQAVNSTGVFLGIKYAAAQMIKQDPHPSGDKGWIVNTASILGAVGTLDSTPYCASKGAVINLTKAAALDCAPHRIHVNCFGPGYTYSTMTGPIFENAERKAQLQAMHPFRGLGTPEDLAKACVFLASEDAQWVTGVYLPVDGGYLAR